MNQSDLIQLYEQRIKPLPRAARLQLLARIAQDLTESEETELAPEPSLLDLEGLGAEIWQDVDAQQYINALRDEWDQQ
jgi:hypothetical protein